MEFRRVIVFFFQAEDGIRDIGVTGVQTCALPIYVVEREIVAVIAPYDVEELIGSVVPIAAIPHAVDVLSCHGNVSADGSERRQRGLVVVSVDETILVLQVRGGVSGLEPAIDDEVAALVVDDVPAVLAQYAVVHGNFLGYPVERLHGSSKDRKSTRLNSSHANISYAVFCL